METKVIKVAASSLKLLDVNARYMKPEMFSRLVENVRKDGCLTQLPFCYKNDAGELVVLSGNHRVRAAIAAGISEIEVQLCCTPLTHDEAVSIQLSHNAIEGEDDIGILKYLYESLETLEAKMYSGLDDETLGLFDKVKSLSLSAPSLDYRMINVCFLPTVLEECKECIKEINKVAKGSEVWGARYQEAEEFFEAQSEFAKSFKVSNISVCMLLMLRYIREHLSDLCLVWEERVSEGDYVPISSVFGRRDMKASEAREVRKYVDYLLSKGEIRAEHKEEALLVLVKRCKGES